MGRGGQLGHRMNKRRTLSALLAICAAPCAWPQPVRAKKVVVLFAGSPEMDEQATAPFFDQLRRLGWIENQNISYERLFGRGSRDKIAELARVAAAKQPDLIYAPTAFAAVSATKATKTIPVVFATVTDPTVSGLVASLARPGANATGTFHIQADLVSKKFEMVREAMPRVRRIGVLLDTKASGDYAQQKQRHHDAARQAGFDLSMADFSSFGEVAGLLTNFKKERIEVVTVASSFTLISRRKEFVELTRRVGGPIRRAPRRMG